MLLRNLKKNDAKPYLLGFSGGPDSAALFHLLLERGYRFEVAHADHGWREESGQEAIQLASLCSLHAIPFHLARFHMEGSNLEDQARCLRLAFFKRVSDKIEAEALLLAHHRDDLAETVLKRLFEGAALHKLGGMKEFQVIEGMNVVRPLLCFSKREILAYLGERSYFVDPTNSDPRFLRARLRETLLPQLSEVFGKQVSPSLCRIGEYSIELQEFVKYSLQEYQQGYGQGGADFSALWPAQRFLQRALLRDFLQKMGLVATAATVEQIRAHVEGKSCHKQLNINGQILVIHERKIAIEKNFLNMVSSGSSKR